MTALVYILVIGLAAATMVGVVYLVLKEQHDHDAHLKYRRSPWDEVVASDHTDAVAEAKREDANKEVIVEPVVGDNPGAHVPLADPIIDSETAADKPNTNA